MLKCLSVQIQHNALGLKAISLRTSFAYQRCAHRLVPDLLKIRENLLGFDSFETLTQSKYFALSPPWHGAGT